MSSAQSNQKGSQGRVAVYSIVSVSRRGMGGDRRREDAVVEGSWRPRPRAAYKAARRLRGLRTQMSLPEVLLWRLLRQASSPIRRQHLLGAYVVDFYCLAAKLVVPRFYSTQLTSSHFQIVGDRCGSSSSSRRAPPATLNGAKNRLPQQEGTRVAVRNLPLSLL